MRFELHIEGKIITSDRYKPLLNLRNSRYLDGVIYGFVMSQWLNGAKFYRKGFSDEKMEEICTRKKKGELYRTICKDYDLTEDALRKRVKRFLLNKQKIQ
jgi:hypothetical protein